MKLDNRYRHGVAILALLIVIVALLLVPKRVEESAPIEQPAKIEVVESVEEVKPTPILSPFDPNTVELRQLLEMGVDQTIAVNLLRFRAAGKIFRIQEELIECRGFNDSLYFALEPYITIGEQYRYKTNPTPEPQKYTPPTIKPLSDSISKVLESHKIFKNREKVLEEESIDLNHADSLTLIALPGIGAKSAEAIIRYRKLLGGYHSVTQLFEIPIITEENFSRFYKYFYTNIIDISKIDVNFASAVELSGHPYFTAARIRRLIKKRNTKGGWRNIEEMTEDNIFTSEEAQHVQPYLVFNTTENPE